MKKNFDEGSNTQFSNTLRCSLGITPPQIQLEPKNIDSYQKAILGKYKLGDAIGEGGMGVVYKAIDLELQREVAIKFMHEKYITVPSAITRFIAEAQVVAQLEHPNLVPLYDLGIDGRKIYIVMRYVQGYTLKSLINNLKKGNVNVIREFSRTKLLQIYQQICMGVYFAHSKGVIHLDLKPENVMLGEFGEVFVMDWGLAELIKLDKELPKQRVITGTPPYMSPEQISGDKIDERSDIYSLGVILYELLTLEKPFQANSFTELCNSIKEGKFEPPSVKAPQLMIPRTLEYIILNAMELNPSERYPSVKVLINEIQGYLEGIKENERKQKESEKLLREGESLLQEYKVLNRRLQYAKKIAESLKEKIKGYEPIEEKQILWQAEDDVLEIEKELVQKFNQIIEKYYNVLGVDPDNRKAQEKLSDMYWIRFREAEDKKNKWDMEFYSYLVNRYHRGKYQKELQGNGTLDIKTNISGAKVILYQYIEKNRILVPSNKNYIGTTPITRYEIPMGSYLLIIKKEGFRDTRYPIYIERNGNVKIDVTLYRDEEIGEGFIYIPQGEFIMGGDLLCHHPQTVKKPFVDDFAISIYPVTCKEYLVFINDLLKLEGYENAFKRTPRDFSGGGYYWNYDKTKDEFILPEIDHDGTKWYDDFPVIGINFYDAKAYCKWLSDKSGNVYRLPKEEEWEKSARGTDGRIYPWGNHFDPTFCNMIASKKETPLLERIGTYPKDESPYGVKDMAGNVSDWCDSWFDNSNCMVKGGCWGGDERKCRVTSRIPVSPTAVYGSVGFRIVKELKK